MAPIFHHHLPSKEVKTDLYHTTFSSHLEKNCVRAQSTKTGLCAHTFVDINQRNVHFRKISKHSCSTIQKNPVPLHRQKEKDTAYRSKDREKYRSVRYYFIGKVHQ